MIAEDTTTKKQGSDLDDCVAPAFDRVAQNIANILATGHPLGSKFHFSQVVLYGQKAMTALHLLMPYLTGEYSFVPVDTDELRIPSTGKPKVFVVDLRHFEEGVPSCMFATMTLRPSNRILALDRDNVWPDSGFPYMVRVDKYINGYTGQIPASLQEVVGGVN